VLRCPLLHSAFLFLRERAAPERCRRRGLGARGFAEKAVLITGEAFEEIDHIRDPYMAGIPSETVSAGLPALGFEESGSLQTVQDLRKVISGDADLLGYRFIPACLI
jgi:hypothetical protein